MIWLITILFLVCFAGITYVLLSALSSGAEAYSGTYSEDTAKQFEDVFLFIPPRRIAELGWSLGAAVFLLLFFMTGDLSSMRGVVSGVVFGGMGGLLALQLPRKLLTILKARRLAAFNLQLVDTLVTMSNALKAGFSILQAFDSVSRDADNPIAQEFGMFLHQTHVGVSFSDALRSMEDRVGSDDLKLMVLAIETARQTGGNLTEIFEQISATIRERMRIEGRIRTLTAQGKLQGIVVGSMPVVIAIALMIVDPDMMRPFIHSTAGLGVAVAVVILVSLGAIVIRRIVTIDV